MREWYAESGLSEAAPCATGRRLSGLALSVGFHAVVVLLGLALSLVPRPPVEIKTLVCLELVPGLLGGGGMSIGGGPGEGALPASPPDAPNDMEACPTEAPAETVPLPPVPPQAVAMSVKKQEQPKPVPPKVEKSTAEKPKVRPEKPETAKPPRQVAAADPAEQPAPTAPITGSVQPAPSGGGEGQGEGKSRGDGAGIGPGSGGGAGGGAGSDGGGTPIDAARADVKPSLLRSVQPEYPLDARRANVTGRVLVRFVVDAAGEVRDVRVVEADPAGVFDDSAREAVRKWKFRPGQMAGRPVPTLVTLPVAFRLNS